MKFQWDRKKARSNLANHGVGFEEAQTVFDDPLAKIFYDEAHSIQEDREIIVGWSESERLLLVSFTERGPDVVRIISAREATKNERKAHEENQGL